MRRSVSTQHRGKDQADSEDLPGMNLHFGLYFWKVTSCGLNDMGLDPFDRSICFFAVAMSDEPSRTFRYEPAKHQDRKSKDCADSESEPPSDIHG